LTLTLRLYTLSAIVVLALLACQASCQMPVDEYLAFRRQSLGNSVSPVSAKASPESSRGKLMEIRGTLSGIAKRDGQTFCMIDSGDVSYIVFADETPEVSSGGSICALVKVGEKCSSALTDLKLAAMTSRSGVEDRERRAIEAEQAAKKAKESARAKRAPRVVKFSRTADYPSRSGESLTTDQFVAAYRNAIKGYNPRLSDREADSIARSVIGFGAKYQVDPRLVVAVILAESHFRPTATSRKGAMGLGQLMPATAAGLGVTDAYDPVQNIAGSARLIRGHLDRMSGRSGWSHLTWQDLSLALASYNAGPGAVRKYGGVPPYRETQTYIKRVISIYKKLCGVP
jgi:soluble lytic murein transglycosylase-like protein